MKIALAQFNPTVGDFSGNSARILELAAEAKKRGADLAVFSELCVCGYPPLDFLERPAFVERNRTELECLAKKLPLPAILGYVGKAHHSTGKSVANNAALVCGGRVVFEQSKILLPTYDVFDESRYFQPGAQEFVYPFGGEKPGMTGCVNNWDDKNFLPKPDHQRDPLTALLREGTNSIINISASPFTLDQ